MPETKKKYFVEIQGPEGFAQPEVAARTVTLKCISCDVTPSAASSQGH